MRAHRTVLVVDDDPLILASVAAALDAAGFQVWTTDSGEEAVRLVERLRPDVVVTDLRMPGMDGLSLLDQLAQRPGPGPGTAIIYSAAPPPISGGRRPPRVRWIPKAPGHEALIDALTRGQQDPVRDS
jgi:CheY-like chemotaxis protein